LRQPLVARPRLRRSSLPRGGGALVSCVCNRPYRKPDEALGANRLLGRLPGPAWDRSHQLPVGGILAGPLQCPRLHVLGLAAPLHVSVGDRPTAEDVGIQVTFVRPSRKPEDADNAVDGKLVGPILRSQ
jgi:hypothetical protein